MDGLLARSRAWFRHAASSGWREAARVFYGAARRFDRAGGSAARLAYRLGETCFAESIRQDVMARVIESDESARRMAARIASRAFR